MYIKKPRLHATWDCVGDVITLCVHKLTRSLLIIPGIVSLFGVVSVLPRGLNETCANTSTMLRHLAFALTSLSTPTSCMRASNFVLSQTYEHETALSLRILIPRRLTFIVP